MFLLLFGPYLPCCCALDFSCTLDRYGKANPTRNRHPGLPKPGHGCLLVVLEPNLFFTSLHCEYSFMTDCPTYDGSSITKSSRTFRHVDFKVFSRLSSFKFIRLTFVILLDRYGKADPGRNRHFFRHFFIVLDRYSKAVHVVIFHLFHLSRFIFRLVTAGLPRKSCLAYTYRSSSTFCLSFASLRTS